LSYSPGLARLFEMLRTDSAVQNAYRASPQAVVDEYGLTSHERDALLTKDLDDFVGIGVAADIAELPPVVVGPRAKGPEEAGRLAGRDISAAVAGARDRIAAVLARIPFPRLWGR
jgi:hypothetical protein